MTTFKEKLVADYLRINFFEVEKLNIVHYLTILRDAFIINCSSTESGVEYLDNAWRLEQTKPDRKKLNERFGKGVERK